MDILVQDAFVNVCRFRFGNCKFEFFICLFVHVWRFQIAPMCVLVGIPFSQQWLEHLVKGTCWELQSHLFQALVLPTFIYGIEIWRGDLIITHLQVFKKGMKMHMMSHIKVRCSTTYRIFVG